MQLTRRERWLFVGLAAFVLAGVLALFGLRPALERIETLEWVIPRKQNALAQLRAQSAEYLTFQAALANLTTQAKGQTAFELLAFVESLTNQLNLAEKVATMNQNVLQLDSQYCEIVVEVKLDQITLKQLVELLLQVKSSQQVLRAKSLYLQKSKTDPRLLDTVIQISTLRPNKTA